MMKYSGNMEFRAFFRYLSSQDESNEYHELDNDTIQHFVDSFHTISLPIQYIEFMRYAGNGQFWRGSMYKFSEVHKLKEYAKELLSENDFPHTLKDNDFVFWMHGGYMFYFFNLDEGNDPPVYYYSECDDLSDFVKCSDSFTGFIINPYMTGVPNP